MPNALAIDLGGTHASVAVVTENTILARQHVALNATQGLAHILPQLEGIAQQLLATCNLRTADCLGVSLSLPSLVNFRTQQVVSCNDKYPDAMQLNLSTWARDAFDLPAAIENDARAALLGEHTAGAARGVSDVLMLTLGTGIGSALLVGGKPFRTSQAQGGNLGGHIAVAVNGRPCTCGAVGCMEAEASTWALPAIVQAWPGIIGSSLASSPHVDFEMLFAAVDQGDPIARAILDHCIRVWSMGTVGLIHAYGPELVLFGGGLMQRAEDILPPLRQYVRDHAWTPTQPVQIQPAALGNEAALYAAIPLLRNALYGETVHGPYLS